MRAIYPAVLAMALPALSLAQPSDSDPDWLKKPSQAQMLSAMPAEALKQGKDGRAVIRCKVSAVGTLTGCAVVSESPEGLGFGAAAIGLAPIFLMKPKVQNGRPVDGGTVTIPITWKGMTKTQTFATFILYNSPVWSAAPTSDDMAAAYPEALRGSGRVARVVLRCGLSGEGRPEHCRTVAQTPDSGPYVDAARRLAPRFQTDVSGVGKELKKVQVSITLAFIDPLSADWRSRNIKPT